MTSFLPADGATTRLHKLNHLVEYCASFSNGCTEQQLIKQGLTLGNTAQKILEYLQVLGPHQLGLLSRRAERYYVHELNYVEWAYAKGFKQQNYTKIITCSKCDLTYLKKLPECPECGESNPFFNEHQGGTHIPIDSIPKEPKQDLTTDLNTHIHTKTPRQERVKEGRKADTRVVKFLGEFGEAKLGLGRNGEPDVLFSSKKASYGVEVKSIEHQVKQGNGDYKAASVPLSRSQWINLCGFADGVGLVPLLFVEVRIRGSKYGSNYYAIPREMVDYKVGLSDAKNIRISVHDLSGLSIQSYKPGMPIPGGFLL